MEVQCKQCMKTFERKENLARDAIENLITAMPPTPPGRMIVAMIKGWLTEGAEDKFLSSCASCEPHLAILRLAIETDDPLLILLKFLMESFTKPQPAATAV